MHEYSTEIIDRIFARSILVCSAGQQNLSRGVSALLSKKEAQKAAPLCLILRRLKNESVYVSPIWDEILAEKLLWKKLKRTHVSRGIL